MTDTGSQSQLRSTIAGFIVARYKQHLGGADRLSGPPHALEHVTAELQQECNTIARILAEAAQNKCKFFL